MCLACTVPYESAPEGTGKLTSLGVLTSEGFRSHQIVLLGSGYRPAPICKRTYPQIPIMLSSDQVPTNSQLHRHLLANSGQGMGRVMGLAGEVTPALAVSPQGALVTQR
jgi:hypothetical protein